MVLDAIALALTIMLAALGRRAGALHSTVRWVALLLASLFASTLGEALAPEMGRWLPNHPDLRLPAATLLGGAGLYVVLWLLGSVTVRFLRLSKLVVQADRALGLVLGAAKGLALSYLLFCFLIVLEVPLTKAFGFLGPPMKGSIGVSFARQHNVVEGLKSPATSPQAPPREPPPNRSPAAQ